MEYRLNYFDHGGNFFSTAVLHADDDLDAVRRARRRFSCGIGMGYEIRREGAHVHTEINQPKPDPLEMGEFAVHFLDDEGRILRIQHFIVDGESDAIAVAAILFETSGDSYAGYEVWRGAKPVPLPHRTRPATKLHQLRDYAQSVVIDRRKALTNGNDRSVQSDQMEDTSQETGAAA